MRLTIAVVGAVLAATLTFVAAGSSQREPVAAGTSDIAAPAQPSAVTIVNGTVLGMVLRGGPHIIHVPQADEPYQRVNSRPASINRRDEPQATIDDDDDEPALAPRRRVAPAPQLKSDIAPRSRAPRWQLRSDEPPPNSQQSLRRPILSAPPPAAEGPTPIRPTPRFNTKADPAEKFAPPRDARLDAPPPPEPSPPTDSVQ
jgi:hypothetical protein